ncbi:signal peptidase II [Tepidamorphus gemmatus]|jgi:signal peptidase II|uniref:Lipoprotein signal peptidase n=1 Tax=Tepidamorphus gemmatus TaxID=747076 RepID=A0A4R3MB84_9HYPH|nr:signal peptidase II [Tepidamorphus gemmatus]TCT09993.1 signal peptidase II [Tepidamorphus gemmatus]
MTVASHLWGRFSLFGGLIALAVFLVDRASKWYLLDVFAIGLRGRVEVTPFFDLVMVWNRGVSYGLFQQDTAFGLVLLAGINFVAAILLWLWLARVHYRLTAVSIALVIGGAIGNGVDRVIYGAVADFFHLHAFGWSWYVFNIADMAIVAGVVGLLYDSLTNSHKRAPKPD